MRVKLVAIAKKSVHRKLHCVAIFQMHSLEQRETTTKIKVVSPGYELLPGVRVDTVHDIYQEVTLMASLGFSSMGQPDPQYPHIILIPMQVGEEKIFATKD